MKTSYEGYYEGIDEFGRIVVAHSDPKFNHYSWFKWKTKIIGVPSKDFIGINFEGLALPDEFKKGSYVKVDITIQKTKNKMTGEEHRKLIIDKMTSI